ncbi:UAA transporter [Lipomyces tetrasporus]|uniref:UAA transporter n=1 Tax=Lipomyces tetrasporus TaxID=54092 RepID=A0AAD7QX88_9ASCO|nr:UAA transporter [Lipomyces tetrasporus]KAJ8103175.1 UAA transporter [Lipomyces tetrasporus]
MATKTVQRNHMAKKSSGPLHERSVVSEKPNGEGRKTSGTSVAKAYLQLGAAQWALILAMIFGGCCSNVFTLEAIVKEDPRAGNLITFVQFLFVAVEGYAHFFTPSRPPIFLPKPHVPFTRYSIIVTMFFVVSFLNNYVWKYHISVPVHIIFRSGGTVMSMVVGALAGKRYSKAQVASISLLTVGVVAATLFDAKKEEPSQVETTVATTKEFAIGMLILFLAQALSAVMSQITELTYNQYGNHWRENLFYMHFLPLPLFFLARKSITDEFATLSASPPIALVPASVAQYVPPLSAPQSIVHLLLNGATQYICVRGVNNLAGTATAVTVTIVLNVRKCVSLLLSIYMFGNNLSLGTCLGAALVFGGAAWYSLESSRLREAQKQAKAL